MLFDFTDLCYTGGENRGSPGGPAARRAPVDPEAIVKERRYRRHYRIVTDVDPRTGRPREIAEYAGEYHRFPAGSPSPRRRAARLGGWHALYWLSALAYLRAARVTGRCIYALVPFMAGVLPAVYGLMGLWALARAPERMTVVQLESGPGRLARSALGCGGFSAAGALGCAVFLSVHGRWGAGWPEPLLAGAAAAAAWAAFAGARRCCSDVERA